MAGGSRLARILIALVLMAPVMLAGGCGFFRTISKEDAAAAEGTATGKALKTWGYYAVGKYQPNEGDIARVPYWAFEHAGCGRLSAELCNSVAGDVTVAQAPPNQVLSLHGHKIECAMPGAGANFAILHRDQQQLFLEGPHKLYNYLIQTPQYEPSPYYFQPNVGPGGVAWQCVQRSH
jgi:hypothetical protein